MLQALTVVLTRCCCCYCFKQSAFPIGRQRVGAAALQAQGPFAHVVQRQGGPLPWCVRFQGLIQH